MTVSGATENSQHQVLVQEVPAHPGSYNPEGCLCRVSGEGCLVPRLPHRMAPTTPAFGALGTPQHFCILLLLLWLGVPRGNRSPQGLRVLSPLGGGL